MNHNNDFRECPFCGTVDPVYSAEQQSDNFSYRIIGTVVCLNCDASITRFGDTSVSGYADNSHVREDVVFAWNRRSSNNPSSKAQEDTGA